MATGGSDMGSLSEGNEVPAWSRGRPGSDRLSSGPLRVDSPPQPVLPPHPVPPGITADLDTLVSELFSSKKMKSDFKLLVIVK